MNNTDVPIWEKYTLTIDGRETERGEMERQKHLAVEVSIKDKPYE